MASECPFRLCELGSHTFVPPYSLIDILKKIDLWGEIWIFRGGNENLTLAKNFEI